MQTTSRAHPSRRPLRSALCASAVATCVALLSAGGCGTDEASLPSIAGAGSGTTGGAGGSGPLGSSGAKSSVGGAMTVGGAATATGGGSGSGGALTGSSGAGSGGVFTGSGGSGGAIAGGVANSGGVGGASKPCVDVEPPPDPKWPGATCQNWANETTECTASWFSNFCDVSCGRCVPAGGGGNGGVGSGGMAAATGGKPCVDVEPPPDPDWPGATCQNWATETTDCKADWFANYCDVSCGRCVPTGGGGAAGSGGGPAVVDCSGEGLPNVTGGEGFATRYWDCCQPHCSQFNGHRCAEDGVSNTGNTQSSCNGGGSFACYDEAPRKISDCLSYGHIAKSNPNCGGCYRIQFTGQGYHNASDPGSVAIKGKQMIVKVSNTGGDVAGNQFDLMIPGGGVGQFNACSRQWGTNDLGAQYGGFLTECTGSHDQKKECVRQECMKIPSGPARNGCLWFVDWLQVADNPKFTSQQTDCPF
jgi:hypothetical protein